MQLLCTTLATVMCDDLFYQIIIISQLRIFATDKGHRIIICLDDIGDILPSGRVNTSHSLTPQVGILMKRKLTIDLTQVEIYLSLIGKTVALTIRGFHMTYLADLTLVFLCLLQNTTVLAVVCMNADTHLSKLVNNSTADLTLFGCQHPTLRLLFYNMITNIVILFRIKTDIIRSGLDLTRLKGYIFLIAVTTVNDDTIVTVLNGSSSKLMTAYLVIDERLPREGKATKPRTVHDFMLAPDTQTIVRTDVF